MDRWQGKVAIVTGASSGIGAAIAEKLVEAGIIVAGIARREYRVKELAEKLKGQSGQLHAFQTDIRKEDQVIRTFELIKRNLGPVHILVNNAGVIRDTSLFDGVTELWQEVLETNVLGLCVATREAIRSMRENKVDGHIVHINSILGHKVADFKNFNVYTASKHGVTALAEILRKELIAMESKIKISSVSPGIVETELPKCSKAFTELFNRVPRLQSEDVAEAVMYVLGTPPHVQVAELIVKANGETY
ncbi:hypothetical protein FQA39_LY07702 [Lamprigera yunnana]|nr:hypothetical protein FQA39_LY07702 [Lamprigera yunnana]